MESNESPASKEGGTSDIEEFIQAVRDILSMDIDKLRAQFLQSSRQTITNVSDALMSRSHQALESQRRETHMVRKQLEEEKKFREEYVKVFGRKEIKDLNKMLEDKEGNIKRLQEEKTKLEEKNKRLEEEKRKAIAEKDNAMTRLSKRMENQMIDNNPNFADLSDQNPPNKLGERYTMLYDNQWLHAFEVLTETHRLNEENAVQILLNILIECHNFAKMRADKQMNDLVQTISGDPTIQVRNEIKRHLQMARKLMDVTRSGLLFQECENHIQDVVRSAKLYLYVTEMKRYLIECFQLCWLMVIQDPPVVLGKKAMKWEDFDPGLYKRYTRSCKFIEFMVWPPLLLREGGPLLAQGVAQPILYTEKQITKHVWDEGGETIHQERLTRTTRKQHHIEHTPVTPNTKADDIPRVRKDESNHRLTTEHAEATTYSSATLSTPPNTSVSKAGNAQPEVDPAGDTDTGYQMQPVKTSYTEINFAWNQDQNATSRYENSGDQISIGNSGNYSPKTRCGNSIKQPDWSYVKSANPTTSSRTRSTEHCYEPLNDTERVRYGDFVRRLKENGEAFARNCYPYSFERYYAIYLASQQTKSDTNTFA